MSTLTSFDLENKVSDLLDNKLSDIKKMMSKMYTLQKRTSDPNKVRTVRVDVFLNSSDPWRIVTMANRKTAHSSAIFLQKNNPPPTTDVLVCLHKPWQLVYALFLHSDCEQCQLDDFARQDGESLSSCRGTHCADE